MAQATTYNVITEPPTNMSVVVVVDKVVFPLKVTSGILYKGDPPAANVGIMMLLWMLQVMLYNFLNHLYEYH